MGKFKFSINEKKKEVQYIKEIMSLLDKEKNEGEKNVDFEGRILKDTEKIIEC